MPGSQTIAQVSATQLRSCVDRVTVVVNSDNQRVIDLFAKENLSLTICPQSRYGIGHSIACGVSDTIGATGWVVALADMPFIKTQTIEAIVEALRKGALIAVPVFRGTRGHPVGFSKKLCEELIQLKGDTGGKDLLRRYSSDVEEVQCLDPGILTDIDTPEDLKKSLQEIGRNVVPLS